MSAEHARQHANDVIREAIVVKSIGQPDDHTYRIFDARQSLAEAFLRLLSLPEEEV